MSLWEKRLRVITPRVSTLWATRAIRDFQAHTLGIAIAGQSR